METSACRSGAGGGLGIAIIRAERAIFASLRNALMKAF
jgi:hypothetical protein